MGDLTDMVGSVSAAVGRTLSTTTVPKQLEAVQWANDGTLLLAGLLCPQPLGSGLFTKGRVDLLTDLIESEEKTGASSGLADLPSANDPILYWLSIQIGTATSKYVAGVTNLETAQRSQVDTICGADALNPICAFGDGKLVYAPKTGPDRADYTFIERPIAMVLSSAEDFPYSDLCIPIVQEYMLFKTYSQREKNLALAQMNLSAFINFVQRLTGLSQEAISNAIS